MLYLWTEGERVVVRGRFDHLQGPFAEQFFDGVEDSRVVDFKELEYISSAGIGVLLKTQKRLRLSGGALKIVNPNHHIRDVFRYAGLIEVFQMD